MKVMVVDAQGGGIGKSIVTQLRKNIPDIDIMAVGTNSFAASAMLKAGADHAASGENAVVVGARNADAILGPVGIVIADSLYGEITPTMALAIGQSSAKRILIPINQCDNIVVGVPELTASKLIQNAVDIVREMCAGGGAA